MAPEISVVITVLNVERTIRDCLNSVLSVAFPKDGYEVIVVDGGSADETVKIIQEYEGVKLLHDAGGSIGSGRNKGIRESRGGIIAVTDGDMTVDANWLAAASSILKDRTIGCVGGPVLTDPSAGRFASYVGAMKEQSPRFREGRVVHHDLVSSGNCAYSRDALQRSGLFNESLVAAEDIELNWRIQRAGYKIFFTPEMRAYHKHRSTLGGLAKQRFRNGVGCGQLLKLNRRIRKSNLRIALLAAFFAALLSTPLYMATGLRAFIIFFEACVLGFLLTCLLKGLESWRETRKLIHIPVVTALNLIALPAWIAGMAYGLTRSFDRTAPPLQPEPPHTP